jgi:hypothetical protein
MSSYPECEKLAAVSETSQKIGEFLDWLLNDGLREAPPLMGIGRPPGVTLACRDPAGGLVPLGWPIEYLLAAYFEIDLEKVENEKRVILGLMAESE